jgi:hypothetical protein
VKDFRPVFERGLRPYVPAAALSILLEWFGAGQLQLKITRPRNSKLGDYRPAQPKLGIVVPRISINGNLNAYSFLVTLTHEYAHHLVWEKYGAKARAHGPEWQQAFRDLINLFLGRGVFPHELENQLVMSMARAKASTCADPGLYRALRAYDPQQAIRLEDLPEGAVFALPNGRQFKKGALRRNRFLCRDLGNGRDYCVAGLAEVRVLG